MRRLVLTATLLAASLATPPMSQARENPTPEERKHQMEQAWRALHPCHLRWLEAHILPDSGEIVLLLSGEIWEDAERAKCVRWSAPKERFAEIPPLTTPENDEWWRSAAKLCEDVDPDIDCFDGVRQTSYRRAPGRKKYNAMVLEHQTAVRYRTTAHRGTYRFTADPLLDWLSGSAWTLGEVGVSWADHVLALTNPHSTLLWVFDSHDSGVPRSMFAMKGTPHALREVVESSPSEESLRGCEEVFISTQVLSWLPLDVDLPPQPQLVVLQFSYVPHDVVCRVLSADRDCSNLQSDALPSELSGWTIRKTDLLTGEIILHEPDGGARLIPPPVVRARELEKEALPPSGAEDRDEDLGSAITIGIGIALLILAAGVAWWRRDRRDKT